MKVYLDASVLKRPFDDQTQPRIRLETEAAVTTLAMAQAAEITITNSAVLRYENSRNPDPEQRRYCLSRPLSASRFAPCAPARSVL